MSWTTPQLFAACRYVTNGKSSLLLIPKNYFKNFLQNIWHHQKIIIIFALTKNN
jgi:hypothetical protein